MGHQKAKKLVVEDDTLNDGTEEYGEGNIKGSDDEDEEMESDGGDDAEEEDYDASPKKKKPNKGKVAGQKVPYVKSHRGRGRPAKNQKSVGFIAKKKRKVEEESYGEEEGEEDFCSEPSKP